MSAGKGLIPQLRADRNGKMVTRHVRADSGTNSGKSLPKPKLSTPSSQPVDEMDTPTPLKPFFGNPLKNKVTDALRKQYKFDEEATVEITSRQWYAARRAGFYEPEMRYFISCGFTDVDQMVAFAEEHDKRFSFRQPPGVQMRRKKWVDDCVAAGITRERFQQADRNFGSYSILNTLEDYNLKGSVVDVINLYADHKNQSTQSHLMQFLWDNTATLEQLKSMGINRVKRHSDEMIHYLNQEDFGFTFDEYVEVVKYEEKRFSSVESIELGRVAVRFGAIKRWGMDRGMELREPGSLLRESGIAESLKTMSDEDSFAFAKHHDEVHHLSIMRDSASSLPEPKNIKSVDFRKSPEYSHLAVRGYYWPSPNETLEYFKVGLSPEDTIESMERGLSPTAALGVKEGGVKSAIAGGWL